MSWLINCWCSASIHLCNLNLDSVSIHLPCNGWVTYPAVLEWHSRVSNHWSQYFQAAWPENVLQQKQKNLVGTFRIDKPCLISSIPLSYMHCAKRFEKWCLFSSREKALSSISLGPLETTAAAVTKFWVCGPTVSHDPFWGREQNWRGRLSCANQGFLSWINCGRSSLGGCEGHPFCCFQASDVGSAVLLPALGLSLLLQ